MNVLMFSSFFYVFRVTKIKNVVLLSISVLMYVLLSALIWRQMVEGYEDAEEHTTDGSSLRDLFKKTLVRATVLARRIGISNQNNAGLTSAIRSHAPSVYTLILIKYSLSVSGWLP